MKKLEKMVTGTVVLACDARKALILRNTGTTVRPSLEIEKVMEAANDGSEEYADRPGRMPDRTSAGGAKGPRSAMEQADVARLAGERFVDEALAALEKMNRKAAFKGLVIAAPAEMLGHLRKQLPGSLKPLVVAEFAKSLTPLPVDKLTAAILES